MAYIKQIIDENTDMTPDVFMHQEEGIEAAHNDLAAHKADSMYKTTGGTSNAQTVDLNSTFDITKDGNPLFINPSLTNTGAMTINPDGQGPKAVKKFNIDTDTFIDVEAGDVKKNQQTALRWDLANGFFVLAPKGGKKIEPLFIVNAKLLGATGKDQYVQLKVINTLADSPNTGYCDELIINATNDYAIGSNYFSPYISGLKRNKEPETWTALTAPAVAPTTANGKITITGDGIYIAKVCMTSPFIYLCKNDGIGFTKIPSPADPPTIGGGIDFSPDGKILLVGLNPGIRAYRFENEVLTQIPFPDEFTGNVYTIKFSHNGKFVLIGSTNSADSFLRVYSVNGEAFTRITAIDVQPPKYLKFVSWNWDDTLISFNTWYDKGSSTYSAYGLYQRNPETNAFTKLAWGATNYNCTEALGFMNNPQNLLFRLEYANPQTPEMYKVYPDNTVRAYPGGFTAQNYGPYCGMAGDEFVIVGDGGTAKGMRIFTIKYSANPNIMINSDSSIVGIGICPKGGAINEIKEISVIAS